MRLRLAALVAALACALPVATADAATDSSSSSTNWAGYVVTRASGTGYRRVSGRWTVPAVDCSTTRSRTYSAHWVGLGGYRSSSRALEQIGTATDCSSSGRATSYAWYELVPDVSHSARITVHQGDVMTASVVVVGHTVRLRLANTTTGGVFSTTLTPSAVDTTSAEWIVEAPSLCSDGSTSSCTQTTLADVGTTGFDQAGATTTGGHVGTIADPLYRRARVQLVSSFGSGDGFPDRGGAGAGGPGGQAEVTQGAASVVAKVDVVDATGARFAVTYAG